MDASERKHAEANCFDLNSWHGIGSDTKFAAETQLLTISGFIVDLVDQQDLERRMDHFLAGACI